jgi:uncharacterized protein
MLKPWGAFIALSVLGFSALDSNAGQTFDCGYAAKSSEKAICDHKGLVKLDAQVNDGYLAVMKHIPKDLKGQVRWEQKAWMVIRNKCGYSSMCLEKSYKGRLSRLAIWQKQYMAK